ncbi:hypothetical protein PMZ80_004068 [Knufia obscura]|uniref:Rho-GAP domain-containing protein n=1 Tax=Knufia obscura TaxID=1635080 RepID=A0ABR0RR84_9EURO|nr:hypothetical protein PMZ80_004068 [Knufia obscura]
MPKAPNVPPLDLNKTRRDGPHSPNMGTLSARSTASTQSPRSPPLSPGLPARSTNIDMQIRTENGAVSPRIGDVSETPSSPGRTSPKQHSRDASKSFFSNLMASKSSHKLQSQSQSVDVTAELNEKATSRSRGNSKDRSLYSMKKNTSTPDLPRLMTANGQNEEPAHPAPPASADGTISKQKSKSKLGGILTRSRSGKPEEDKKNKQRPPAQLNLEVHPPPEAQNEQFAPPKTAPMKQTFRDQIQAAEGASIRNRSADRIGHEDARRNEQPGHPPGSAHRDNNSLFANIQQTGRGVGDRLGKAGRGWFSKMTRSGSTNERELVPDEHYVCTTINLPLVKQTRKTRIAKKLELSKDKTEYWMPALPWRCIDYLNMQCEQEGLYRVPGSGRDVKFWQRRFDTEHDINLFDEPELYDVNTIASMFKAWLRDLPDELFPKAVQTKIVKECHGATRTPQALKDELSKLPPFNYYLLFAITCHLSLLHSYADQNKMDYRNLCICFQPCLKIDAFCFQFLVIDWKECWQQGCWTEKEYLQEELRYERAGEANERDRAQSVSEERAISSSNSSANMQSAPVRPPRNAEDNNTNGMSRPSLAQLSQAHSEQQQQYQGSQQSAAPPQLKPKQRSLSSSGRERTRTPSHGHAQTAPAVPRLVTRTPEQEPVRAQDKLPELGSMSPIRM